jgi:uncharacterized protein YabE (DUF348 family)
VPRANGTRRRTESTAAARASHPAGTTRRLLQVTVVLSLIGGTAGLANAHKTVTIDVDGQIRRVSAYGRTVGDVLDFQHVAVARGDAVTPSSSSDATDGATIVVRSAHQVTLEVDGATTTFTTTALTVGDLISALGARGDGAVATASRSQVLDGNLVRVSTMKTVTVVVDGAAMPIRTTRASVRDVLNDAGITLQDGDTTSVPLGAAAADGMVVFVARGSVGADTVTEVLPFETRTIEEPALPQGYRRVRTAGRPGEATTIYATKLAAGAEVERAIVSQTVSRKPVDEVIVVGTKDPATITVDPGSSRATARALAAERGWGDDQFGCLDSLWTKESGWRSNAENRSSGAYGIAQALPGSKMATVADDWRTNPVTQITWGLGYIAGRYGTPCAAWEHSIATGWY